MSNTYNLEQNQAQHSTPAAELETFLKKSNFGTLLNRCNIAKTKGASPLQIFSIIFNLAFTGKNIFFGIVRNSASLIGKDAVYDFLNNATYNWRKLNLLLIAKLYIFFKHLIDDSSEEVLIFDDSTYDRSRSKKVELLAKVFDHTFRKYLKGFRMLTLGWSDGNSFLGIDFALLSSKEKQNRYQEITKDLDKRTCGYKRRQEANPFRVKAYRRAADTLSSLEISAREIVENEGLDGLVAPPNIGEGISQAIYEMLRTGRWTQLERLHGKQEPQRLFQSVPGIGPDLAQRIYDTLSVDSLEALETAVHDGRLDRVPGIGKRRVAAIRSALAEMLSRRSPLAFDCPSRD